MEKTHLKWLIVEDALRDRKGHWFEYIGTFVRELRTLCDDVTVLADGAAEPFIVQELQAQPVLPASIWHRMSDGAGVLQRYSRVPVHAWKTYRTMRAYLRGNEEFDVIFVPTVLVHHLLGWVWLIKRTLQEARSRVILFFPNTPIQLNPETNEPAWLPSPTAKLFCRLIRSLRNEVKNGRVILGAETQPMREALTRLTGVPFTYFPHPVCPLPDAALSTINYQLSSEIVMASYGSARHEKGSDLLVAAADEYCRRHPDSRVRFVFQCVDWNGADWKRLNGNPKVELISNYFANGEYARRLRTADVLMLPYRRSSYALRVSRVAIEGMVHGLPAIATRDTTLAGQAKQFGAVVECDDENVESLVGAIGEMELNQPASKELARIRQPEAQKHFSVLNFRRILVEPADLGKDC